MLAFAHDAVRAGLRVPYLRRTSCKIPDIALRLSFADSFRSVLAVDVPASLESLSLGVRALRALSARPTAVSDPYVFCVILILAFARP